MTDKRQFDLQERFIAYAVRIVKLAAALPATATGRHIATQLLRSGTSPAANHAEAQSAESRPDFIHKLKIALKELRETGVWLRIITDADLLTPATRIEPLLEETDKLCAILYTSIATAQRNHRNNIQQPTSDTQLPGNGTTLNTQQPASDTQLPRN